MDNDSLNRQAAELHKILDAMRLEHEQRCKPYFDALERLERFRVPTLYLDTQTNMLVHNTPTTGGPP